MREIRKDVVQTTVKLIKTSISIGLCVNKNKTKYMLMSRKYLNDLSMTNLKFVTVKNFKYLRVNINNNNNMHLEVNKRVISVNRYYLKE